MLTQSNINIDTIVNAVLKELKEKLFITMEASGRHIHLCREDINKLFGYGYQLTPVKELSQPGQYACEERLTITGPKNSIKNVVVLGPERGRTQVEISLTDGLTLGVKAPVRLSGDIDGTPGIVISNPKTGASIEIKEGLIVAKRHIHITPEDAAKFNVSNGEIVKVKVFGERPVILEDVDVRVNKNFSTAMHIDYDEANACGFNKNTKGLILKEIV
ncbi:ethanolamine utilization phosphate acetyltransferase EutD [Clostridium sp. Marseille-P299]|uniref:ethanolamine utilization phosphate acetyltransferase EutD n=1 Tax=Clostridium sp. Marseille-P299 TaxID=1805477 RepID=UPI000835252C|nr:ethanolamine utilization phosphate acetyltransferase EutD [Clostridium sp. Marseille-P299]